MHKSFIAVMLTSLALMACDSSDEDVSSVINHLEETRSELRELKQEVSELRKEIIAAKNQPTPVVRKGPPIVEKLLLDNDDPVIGDDDAEIVVVEFTDYQCGFCARFHSQTYSKLKQAYLDTGKVKFISRDFPLGFHTKAKDAAIAANCAAKQGKFEVMRADLFSKTRQLSRDLFVQLAKKHKLDSDKFNTCMQNPDMAKEVDADMAYGQKLGVNGTPSFFIGKLVGNEVVQAVNLRGAQPYQAFANTVDSLLN